MGKFDELEEKVRHYRWLKDIAADYDNILCYIKREKDYFRVYGLFYSARSDTSKISLNCHRPIPCSFIIDGLQAALDNIHAEMSECEKELDGWI